MLTRRSLLRLGAAAAAIAAAAAAVPKAAQAAYRRFGETPTVWLPLDGRTLSRRDYPELYELLRNTTFGGADFGENFQIADMRQHTDESMVYMVKARRGTYDSGYSPIGTIIPTKVTDRTIPTNDLVSIYYPSS